MSSSIAMSVLRQENGKKYGTWQAREVSGTTAAPRLVAECTLCGNRQFFDINQWYAITKGRSFQCTNLSGHRAETKAVPQAQPLSLEVLKKMPSDELKRRILHEPGFKEQANAIYNSAPKELNYREAREKKIALDEAARLAPQRTLFERAYYAYEAQGGTAPFNWEQWLRMPESERSAIVKHFDLHNVDYKEQVLGQLFGRS